MKPLQLLAMPSRIAAITVGSLISACTGCSTTSNTQTPVPRVASVDVQRYSGPWYIIASIPLPVVEKGAFNPVETYTPKPDGTIETIFQFRKDSFDGKLETKPTYATIEKGTNNAEWRVRTIWPLKQQYVISHLEPDYSSAIVARDSRDYVWILSRTPAISDARLAEYRSKIALMGYDLSKLIMFPQNGAKPS